MLPNAVGAASLESGFALIYLSLLTSLAAGAAVLAHQVWQQSDVDACRRLRNLAAVQAGGALLRLVETQLGVAGWPILVAGQSVLDLGILALALLSTHLLFQRGLVSRERMVLATVICAGAFFWGMLGAESGMSFLLGHPLAAASHLAFFGLMVATLLTLLLNRLHGQQEELHAQCAELSLQGQRLQRKVREAERATILAEQRGSQDREQTGQLRVRMRALEQILCVSAHLNATRNLAELLDQVVKAARDILGFRMVVLRLYSVSTEAFEARAFAGVPEEGKAHLTNLQISLSEYHNLAQTRFQISSSYFLGHADDAATAVTKRGYMSDLGPRAAGEWHAGDALITPLISPNGEVRGYLSVDDPADRQVPPLAVIRQLEFLMQQAATAIESAEIYDRLAQRNSELAQATDQLKSLGEMKSNFVANVSHELRTPLTSITAYTEILQNGAQSMSEETRNEFLKVINREGDRLSEIIDDLLDLSRMETGRASCRRDQLNLVDMIERLEAGTSSRAAEKDIDFRCATSHSDILLDADSLLMQQLLEHLLSNAFKFTPPGGRVRLEIADEGEAVRILVEDSGIGIPEEKLRDIFDRFYQVDDSSTREHGGQGVGLAICHDIVRHHDGRIWAENIMPQGARFQVLLPRRPQVIHGLGWQTPSTAGDAPSRFMERLIHWISESLGTQIVSIMRPDSTGQYLTIQAAIGLPESVVHGTQGRKGAGIAGKVWSSGRSLLVPDILNDKRFAKLQNDPKYTTPSVLSVPLIEGLDVLGVVNVNTRRDGQPLDEDNRLLLEAMAPRIGHLLRMHDSRVARTREFEDAQATLQTMVQHRMQYQDELTQICHAITLGAARRIKLPAAEMEHLALALQCYDLGLSRVSGPILCKKAALSPSEREETRKHVSHSLEILAPLQASSKVRQIVLHHHERYDGRGYPDGLEGEAIPIGARLVALADSLNAMLQGRPYRPPRFLAEAMEEIESLAGFQFCPRLTEPFLLEARLRRQAIEKLQQIRVPAAAPLPMPADSHEAAALSLRPAVVPSSSPSL